MNRNRFRIGSIAVLFAVVVLCVAIFGVLTVSSAVSDRRAAERYGEHVEVLYACENAGQDWLSEADAYLKGAGDLPENTEETETTLKTEITRGNMQLEICLNKINGSYEIAKWRCTARWQPDDSLNLGYRSLYTRLCRAAVDRLLKLGRITDAEKLCTGVIRLDPAAEEFSVFLMQALIKNKNPEKALEHYDYIASLYREVYGVSPSAELEAQKALAVQELYGSETSEDDIQTFLLEKEQETGAFCCDNNVFREIVKLHVREMRRNDTPAALMIVRLANRSIDPEKRAIYMKQMEVTLLNELRAGDPFTKVGANQFWVLLPGATGENGGLVSRRVFNRFQKENPKSGAAYTFKSLDLRHIHMSAEEKATEKTERRKA